MDEEARSAAGAVILVAVDAGCNVVDELVPKPEKPDPAGASELTEAPEETAAGAEAIPKENPVVGAFGAPAAGVAAGFPKLKLEKAPAFGGAAADSSAGVDVDALVEPKLGDDVAGFPNEKPENAPLLEADAGAVTGAVELKVPLPVAPNVKEEEGADGGADGVACVASAALVTLNVQHPFPYASASLGL